MIAVVLKAFIKAAVGLRTPSLITPSAQCVPAFHPDIGIKIPYPGLMPALPDLQTFNAAAKPAIDVCIRIGM